MFLGHARGKVGSVVFYRANGQQVTRALAEVVSNPKSVGQREQRAIFSTVAKLAAALRPIVDHSWQSINDKTESMRHFRRLALGAIRTAYTAGDLVNLSARNHPSFAPNAVPVSAGTLPSIAVARRQVPADDPAVMIVGNILSGVTSADMTFATLRQVFPGLQPGDQLTVLVVKTDGDMSTGDYISRVAIDRMVFAPYLEDNTPVYSVADGWAESAFDMTKTTSLTMLDPVVEGQSLYMQANAGDNAFLPTAGTIIHSRLADTRNAWEYSSQSLLMVNIDNYVDNEAALQSYAQTVSSVTSEDYLDQATVGTIREGMSGAYATVNERSNDYLDGDWLMTPGNTYEVSAELVPGTDAHLVGVAYGTDDNQLMTVEFGKESEQYVGAPSFEYVRPSRNTARIDFTIPAVQDSVTSWVVDVLWKNGGLSRLKINVTLRDE